jgi:hypothetical protein
MSSAMALVMWDVQLSQTSTGEPPSCREAASSGAA